MKRVFVVMVLSIMAIGAITNRVEANAANTICSTNTAVGAGGPTQSNLKRFFNTPYYYSSSTLYVDFGRPPKEPIFRCEAQFANYKIKSMYTEFDYSTNTPQCGEYLFLLLQHKSNVSLQRLVAVYAAEHTIIDFGFVKNARFDEEEGASFIIQNNKWYSLHWLLKAGSFSNYPY